MFRTIALTAAIAVIASSASAQDVRVKMEGKNDAALQQDIRTAARKVCAAYTASVRGLEPAATCFKYALRDAETQVTQAYAQTAKPTKVASK